jgi:hypothetical protein
MQGSPKEHPTLALPSCSEERIKLAEKCLANYIFIPKISKTGIAIVY